MSSDPKIWVISDEKTGRENQSMGVAAKIVGDNYDIHALSTIEQEGGLKEFIAKEIGDIRSTHNPKRPDIVIASGFSAEATAASLKRQSGGKIFTTQLSLPGRKSLNYDVQAVPNLDPHLMGGKLTKIVNAISDSIILTTGVPHKVTEALLQEGKEQWEYRFNDLPEKKIAVLLGGDTRHGEFTGQEAKRLAEMVDQFAKENDFGVIITNSRRTSDEATQAFYDNITAPSYLHHWDRDIGNPYLGLLAIADVIMPTSDSLSMCSEACFTQKPVLILDNKDSTSILHQIVMNQLEDQGYAKKFTDHDLEGPPPLPPKRLDEAARVAEFAMERFERKQHKQQSERTL